MSAATERCPTCDEPKQVNCKCPDSHARCINGHWWVRRTGVVVQGPHSGSHPEVDRNDV